MKKLLLIPIIIGGVIATAAVAYLTMVLVGASTTKTQTNEYVLTEDFDKFDISLSIADIKFVASDTKKVVCQETNKLYHDVNVENGTLKIDYHKNYNVWDYIYSPYKINIAVYLPIGAYQTLNLTTATGDVNIPGDYSFVTMNASSSTGDLHFESDVLGDINVTASTGNITLKDVDAKNVNATTSTGRILLDSAKVLELAKIRTSTGGVTFNNTTAGNVDVHVSTGDVKLTNTLVATHTKIETSTGDVRFEDSDSYSLDIKTSTGDVSGTLLSGKSFIVEAGGKVKITAPEYSTGGECKIKTSTGDVIITVKGA